MKRAAVESLITSLKHAAQPAVSPDGSQVAYVVHATNPTTYAAESTLWRVRIDGTGTRQVPTNGEQVSHPIWKSDGETLLYVATEGERSVLRELTADGSDREIGSFPAAPSGLALAPDGNRLAFVAHVDPDASEPLISGLPAVRVINRIDYKEDGYGIPNNAQYQVHVMHVETGEVRQITTGQWHYSSLAWSPDGRKLAGIRRRRIGFESMLVIIDSETDEEAFFAQDHGSVRNLAWMRDGGSIIWSRCRLHKYTGEFMRLEVASGEMQKLCDLPVWAFGYLGEPLIAISATEMLGAGHEAARTGLWKLDIERGSFVQVFADDAMHDELVADAIGSVVVQIRYSANETSELVAINTSTGASTRITHLNDEWFREHPPAGIELRSVRHEQFDVPYLVKLPHDFDPNRKYPVVFEMHGGPHMFRGFAIESSNQILNDAGYIVVNPNPRGSTSWSLEYASGVYGDWGGGDWRDDMAVFDTVAALPYVDETRMGIYGYSYGGYITSWAIGQTDRFRAAIIGAPLTDLISREGTADLGFDSPWAEFRGSWKEIPEYFSERSPVTHMHKAVTPTLIMHPEDDQRCPIGQSEQLFVGLKMAGVEAEFVRYPGQSHLMPWTGPAEYMIDFYSRIVDWFERWLT